MSARAHRTGKLKTSEAKGHTGRSRKSEGGHLGEHREGPELGPVLGRLGTNGKGSERKKECILGLGRGDLAEEGH